MIFSSMRCRDAIALFDGASSSGSLSSESLSPLPPLLLGHRTRCGGLVLEKGRRLSHDDFRRLLEAGVESVAVARFEEGDVDENLAADRIGAQIAGAGLAATAAMRGRVNVHALTAGVFEVDREGVDRLNAVDESITLASLAPDRAVAAGDLAATAKIIPYAVSGSVFRRAEAALRRSGFLLNLRAFRRRRVVLISGESAAVKPGLIDKAERVIGDRLAALGGNRLERCLRAPHGVEGLTAALGEASASGAELILILGASAIVDRRDAAPAAIVAQGGEIEHFGLPCEPGNMFLLGRIGKATAMGLPGCVRSPAMNGFDLVLQRYFSGMSLGREDLMRMGCGGLFKASHASPPAVRRSGARLEGIVLAAGRSRRMPGIVKVLAPLGGGETLLSRATARLASSRIGRLIAVVGDEAEKTASAVRAAHRPFADRCDLEIVVNAAYARGIGTSIAAAMEAVSSRAAGVLLSLSDMPNVGTDHFDRLIAAFDIVDRPLAASRRGEIFGAPAVFGRLFFAALAGLDGDRGAHGILSHYAALRHDVEAENEDFFVDLDTPEALRAYRGDEKNGDDAASSPKAVKGPRVEERKDAAEAPEIVKDEIAKAMEGL